MGLLLCISIAGCADIYDYMPLRFHHTVGFLASIHHYYFAKKENLFIITVQNRGEIILPPKKLDVKEKIQIARFIEAKEAKIILEQAIRQRRFIQLIGNCAVEYRGRARSILTEGERLILVKRDGSFLVHTENGVEPVNWQPPGATLKLTIEDERLCLYANRTKPKEMVKIVFYSILLLIAVSLQDTGEFSMYLTEEEMQKVLSAHPELVEPGLRTIRRERPVAPGFIDIFARDQEGRIVVIEIKRRRADREAVLQLYNYIKHLQPTKAQDSKIRGILVAPNLTKGTHSLLKQLGLEYCKIEPQQCYQYLQHPTTRRLTEFTSDESNSE